MKTESAQVQAARIQVVNAERDSDQAKARARAAKCDLKKAKEVARRAKKQFKKAKAALSDATKALAAAEAKRVKRSLPKKTEPPTSANVHKAAAARVRVTPSTAAP